MKKALKRIGLGLVVLLLSALLIAAYAWLKFAHTSAPLQNISFESRGDTIMGTLTQPENDAPVPAVIILHGSGPLTGDGMAVHIQAKAFLKRGFAVLAYDKRGTGKSGGTFRNEDYEYFLSDIHAALDFLKKQPGIRADAIGLATNSESGFFAPQLASERKDIAFIYNRVGPVVDFTRVAHYQMEILMKTLHKPEDVGPIMTLYEDIYRFFIKADGNPDYFNSSARDELNQRMQASWQKHGSNLPYGRSTYSAYNAATMRRLGFSRSYDPRHYFKKPFDTPLYYAFAENDINVPTEESVESLKKIKARGQHNIRYKIWPGVDHTMNKFSFLLYGAYPKGYLDEMADWALSVVNNK